MEEKNMKEINDENIKNLLDDELLEEGEGVVSINQLKKKKVELDRKNKILIGVLVFLVIISLLLYGVKYFFDISLKGNNLSQVEQTYMNIIKDYVLKYVINVSSSNKTFYNENKKSYENVKNMDSFIKDPGIIFYQKQFRKKDFINKEYEKFGNILKNIKNTQDLLTKYKFFPQQLNGLIKDIRIMPILLTLNSIKIYMIDYVYIQIGKFDEEILDPVLNNSSILTQFNINKNIFKNAVIKDIQKIRELGIYLYLKNIRFNYMYDKLGSSLVNDYYTFYFYKNFQNIFDKRAKELGIRLKNNNGSFTQEGWSFIKNYIFLLKDIYDKTSNLLENEKITYLPVNIKLLSYDPKLQKLSFNVDIMLENIYNTKVSVIKIATKIVTLLRESRLIIGSNIKMNNLKVQKFTQLIGGTKITFDKISLLFNTSVQSEVNVEVTDMNR